jgi:NFU1 iron-sulfur cluster scaffold homolog, mitochondrial
MTTHPAGNSSEVLIRVQDTPNPSAWKFILDRPVLTEGKASFLNPTEALGIRLVEDLFAVPNVKQVHFFQNVITVTATFDADPIEVQQSAVSVIQTRMPIHNPNFGVKDVKALKRQSLSPDLQRIEEILDQTIRPGLQGDGGDLEVVRFEDNKLYVAFEGACGTCPSSTTGTLMAIEGILREQFQAGIEVIPL